MSRCAAPHASFALCDGLRLLANISTPIYSILLPFFFKSHAFRYLSYRLNRRRPCADVLAGRGCLRSYCDFRDRICSFAWPNRSARGSLRSNFRTNWCFGARACVGRFFSNTSSGKQNCERSTPCPAFSFEQSVGRKTAQPGWY